MIFFLERDLSAMVNILALVDVAWHVHGYPNGGHEGIPPLAPHTNRHMTIDSVSLSIPGELHMDGG